MGVNEGIWIKGSVSGIEVEGYWTGRGILVQWLDPELKTVLVPLTTWDQRSSMEEATYVGKHFIQVGGEYLLDGEPVAVSKW